MHIEGGYFPIQPEKTKPIAKSNPVRKPHDEYDKSNASKQRQEKEQQAHDTLEISQAYQELKKAQSESDQK